MTTCRGTSSEISFFPYVQLVLKVTLKMQGRHISFPDQQKFSVQILQKNDSIKHQLQWHHQFWCITEFYYFLNNKKQLNVTSSSYFLFWNKNLSCEKENNYWFQEFCSKSTMFYYHNSKNIVIRGELVMCGKRSVRQWIQLHPFMIFLAQIF